jgi:hypothetical protein
MYTRGAVGMKLAILIISLVLFVLGACGFFVLLMRGVGINLGLSARGHDVRRPWDCALFRLDLVDT